VSGFTKRDRDAYRRRVGEEEAVRGRGAIMAGDKFRLGRTMDEGVLLLGPQHLAVVLPAVAGPRRPVLRADERRAKPP
jgi:hypothetical protein